MSTEDVSADDCDSPLLVLDLGLHIVDGVRRLHLEGDGLTREAAKRVSTGRWCSKLALLTS